MDFGFPVVLASASPRRCELLRLLVKEFEILTCSVDETPWDEESPEHLVMRLAERKARTIQENRPDSLIIGADTIVVCDGRIWGKPSSLESAREMLRHLSGNTHEVFTGVAVLKPDFLNLNFSRSEVSFFPMSEEEITCYLHSGEPMDKAGAYAIQGQASRFVEKIDGCYFNVVGLPVSLLYRMLLESGYIFHG
jgi:septum formation protein